LHRQRCIDSGCTDFLTKPVHVDRLLTTVAKYTGVSTQADPNVETRNQLSLAANDEPEALLLHELGSLREISDAAIPSSIRSSLPMNDPEMAEIVRDFVPKMQERIANMKRDAQAGRWKDLDEHAHWLMGSAGTTGFQMISALAGKLQIAAYEKNQGGCKQLCSAIEQMAESVELV